MARLERGRGWTEPRPAAPPAGCAYLSAVPSRKAAKVAGRKNRYTRGASRNWRAGLVKHVQRSR